MTYNAANSSSDLSSLPTTKGDCLPTTGKTYGSVSEMFRDLSVDENDKSFSDELQKELRERCLVHFLFGLRSARNVSQKDIATHMGCSQSRVSKLESGVDEDLRLGDLRDYLSAMAMTFKILVCEEKHSVFDEIKFHAFRIKHCLDRMVELAGADPEISKGVSRAHVETLLNMIKIVVDSAKNLPDFPGDVPSIIEVDDAPSACSTNRIAAALNEKRAAPVA